MRLADAIARGLRRQGIAVDLATDGVASFLGSFGSNAEFPANFLRRPAFQPGHYDGFRKVRDSGDDALPHGLGGRGRGGIRTQRLQPALLAIGDVQRMLDAGNDRLAPGWTL